MIGQKDLQTFRDPRRILLRERAFAYLLPHPALREYISNYTVTFPSQEIISDQYTVLPHGSATLVYSFDGGHLSGRLFGPLTRPCAVGRLANRCQLLVIVEFQPGGLSAFTGVPQGELTDRTVPFELLEPALDRSLLETLERSRSLEELIAGLDRRLLAHLRAARPPALQLAAALLIRRSGNISAKELSASAHYSPRHLNRLFETYLGMSAKTLARLVRVNRAIRLLRDPRRSVTYASCEAGFYDLPHFIHDFKAVCGMTPGEYRENMSDFYNEIAKFQDIL